MGASQVGIVISITVMKGLAAKVTFYVLEKIILFLFLPFRPPGSRYSWRIDMYVTINNMQIAAFACVMGVSQIVNVASITLIKRQIVKDKFSVFGENHFLLLLFTTFKCATRKWL